jgi:alkylhydroperoxidase family enzyme
MPLRVVRFLILAFVLVPASSEAQRVSTPRVPPLEPSEWTDEHKQILGSRAQGANTRNTFKICLRNPALCRSWLPLTTYVESKESTLPPRDREILILRTTWLSGNDLTWGPHEAIAKRLGLTDDDIVRITKGPGAPGWSPFDAALVRAADELHNDQFVQDGTWKILAGRYDDRQMMDAIFAVGQYTLRQYTLIAMYLNSTGAQLGPADKKLPR